MAGASFRIGDSGKAQEIFANGITPNDGVAGLVFKASKGCGVAVAVNQTLQRLPLLHVIGCSLCAFVMRIINVLDDGFAGMKHVSVRDVMEKEQQLVGRRSWRFVELRNERRILSHITGASGDAAIHADTVMIGAVPLAPAVFF